MVTTANTTPTPANETFSSCSRTTKEGRKMTYTLEVVQQPERARACGSGAKCEREIPYTTHTC